MYLFDLLKQFIENEKKKCIVIDQYISMPLRRLEIMRYINNTGPDP